MERIGSALENIVFNNAILGAILGFLGKDALDRLTLVNKLELSFTSTCGSVVLKNIRSFGVPPHSFQNGRAMIS
jgi:hypothetical protein